MRLQKISSYYLAYLKRFYAARPELAAEPYSLQHAALMSDCIGISNFWTEALSRLGYVTDEIVANAEALQKRWATENGAAYDEDDWLLEIVSAQVKAFQPEVLIVADYVTFSAGFIRQLRAECSSIRLVIGWCSAPYKDASVFHGFDFILSCIPEMVAHFRQAGHRCFHLNHAFAPAILEKIDTKAAANTAFSFLGSIVKRDDYHNEREKLLLALIRKTPLEIWSDIYQLSLAERSGAMARQVAYDAVQMARRVGVPQVLLKGVPFVQKVAGWETRPGQPEEVDERIVRRAHPPVFGLQMYQQLQQSKVTLNTHIDISPRCASNMRLYEATGVGTCLLTDWKENLSELFEPETEVVSYRSTEECIEKARYLLENENERQAIAAAGQRRTLRSHTYAHRAEQISAYVQEYFSQVNG